MAHSVWSTSQILVKYQQNSFLKITFHILHCSCTIKGVLYQENSQRNSVRGLLEYFVVNLQLGDAPVPPLLRASVDEPQWAETGARDGLVAEGQDRSSASSFPAVAAFLWSWLCPRHWEHGGLPAVCADPQWVFSRNLSNVFQELRADHSLIICFKR